MRLFDLTVVKTYYDVDEPLTHKRVKEMFMKDKLYNPNEEYCFVDRQDIEGVNVCRILKHPLSD